MSDICDPVRRSKPLRLPSGLATMSMIAEGLLPNIKSVTSSDGSTWFECTEVASALAQPAIQSNWMDE
jgi:hypothetical protein